MNEVAFADIAARGAGYGVWTLVLIALITLIKGWPALRKLSIEADGSLRKDLLERIRQLEESQRADEKNFENAMREERERCDTEMAKQQAQITALERQLITFQIASGRPMRLDTPATDAAMEQLQRRLDDIP